MTWELVVFVTLLTIAVGYLWFDNIRFFYRWWRWRSTCPLSNEIDNLVSSKITSNTKHNDNNNKPKPKRMHSVETPNNLSNLEYKPNEARHEKHNKSCLPKKILTVYPAYHTRIISRLKKGSNRD